MTKKFRPLWWQFMAVMALCLGLVLSACGDTATSAAQPTAATTTSAAATTTAMATTTTAMATTTSATTSATTTTTAAMATTAMATTTTAMTSATAGGTAMATTTAASGTAMTGATSGTGTGADISTASGTLTVFAAASLTGSFNQMKAAIEKANPNLKITFNFGGSNTLVTQLTQGAKADVFASADTVQMGNAVKGGVISGNPVNFANNKLVLILPKSNPAGITKLQDIAKSGIKFDTAEKSVPVGNYTLQILDKMSKDASFGSDFSTKVQANFVSKETDVKQIVAKVQSGEADAGIVYYTDAAAAKANLIEMDIPDQFNVIATYPIAVVKGAPNATAAQAFINYVTGPDGQAILKQAGFITGGSNS